MSSNQLAVVVVDEYFNQRYHSYPILGFSIFLSFYVHYIVWTQSTMMGNYKYYLLNQLIWAQLLQFLIIMLNPVFLNPFMAGYMGGLFRHIGSYKFTLIMDIISFSIYVNCVWGTTLSLLNRYIFTFYPQYRTYIENKWILSFFLFSSLCCYSIISVAMVRTLDSEVSREYLRNETEQALLTFIDEPTLIYISENGGITRILAAIAFVMLLGASSLLGLGVVWFIFQVYVRSIVATTVIMFKSLVLTSIVQTILCLFFLITPILFAMGSWAWKIEGSNFIVNVWGTILPLHGTVDMLSILFFVAPYRKYTKNWMSNVWRRTFGGFRTEPEVIFYKAQSRTKTPSVTL